ncbi:MAG: hypothetical protein Q8J99_03575, partial [Sulfuritalea sp.]|nr:hypothetical protein [Sulfuritalea sp.]
MAALDAPLPDAAQATGDPAGYRRRLVSLQYCSGRLHEVCKSPAMEWPDHILCRERFHHIR